MEVLRHWMQGILDTGDSGHEGFWRRRILDARHSEWRRIWTRGALDVEDFGREILDAEDNIKSTYLP